MTKITSKVMVPKERFANYVSEMTSVSDKSSVGN